MLGVSLPRISSPSFIDVLHDSLLRNVRQYGVSADSLSWCCPSWHGGLNLWIGWLKQIPDRARQGTAANLGYDRGRVDSLLLRRHRGWQWFFGKKTNSYTHRHKAQASGVACVHTFYLRLDSPSTTLQYTHEKTGPSYIYIQLHCPHSHAPVGRRLLH